MRRRLLCLLATALLLSACGVGDSGSEGGGGGHAYVGAVEGTEAFIGLVTDGSRVAGHVSDGETIAIWLGTSEITDGLAELRTRTGDFEGSVEFYDGGARGEVQIEGAPYSFDAQPAEGQAGVFWEDTNGGENGWVVNNDGETKGPGDEAGGVRLTDPGAEAFTNR